MPPKLKILLLTSNREVFKAELRLLGHENAAKYHSFHPKDQTKYETAKKHSNNGTLRS